MWNGHFYSNKAPGLAFAAIPGLPRAARRFSPPRSGTAAIFVLAARAHRLRLSGPRPLSDFARRLASLARRGRGGPDRRGAVAFGTPFLYYARSFFSHAWSASLLISGVRSDPRIEREPCGPARALLVGAGLLAGWASISEYPVAPFAALFALRRDGVGPGGPSSGVGGAAPSLGMLLSTTRPASARRGCSPPPGRRIRSSRSCPGAGCSASACPAPRPRPSSSPPVAGRPRVFAVPSVGGGGLVRWWRCDRGRDCRLVLAACTGRWFLPIAAIRTGKADGAWGAGTCCRCSSSPRWRFPRPMRAHSRGACSSSRPRFSVANLFLLTSAYPHIPPTIRWPAANLSWFLISSGAVAPNLGRMAGLAPAISLLLTPRRGRRRLRRIGAAARENGSEARGPAGRRRLWSCL